MEGMSIEVLTELATEVVTSPDKAVRDTAAARLRFMSCYDHWEDVKSLLPHSQNNYLRFIICKAMHFVVSNELGPQERKDMQVYVLDYLTMMNERGEVLPSYVRNELYSIYASAMYINWKLMVISLESESRGMGKRIVDELSARFPANDVLDCILEVLTYFAKQELKGSIEYVRLTFLKEVLPTLFEYSAGQIPYCGHRALEVCCTTLETVSSLCTEPLITLRLTTDDSVYLESGVGWFPALSLAVQECGRAILDDPTMELSGQCARFLRMASTVVCVDPEWFQTRNTLIDSFLALSGDLLDLYKSTGFSHILQLACALLVNGFERDEGKVTTFLYNRSHLIELWAEAVNSILDRWDDGEEELRQELMHMFFLFGDRVIPRVTASESGDTRTLPIMTCILQVAQCYFDNVVAKAHLTDDSNEMRSDVGVMLHNEKTLLPVAEMLFCEKVDFCTPIVQRLQTTIEQYEACVRAREAGNLKGIGDVLLSLAVNVNALGLALGSSDVPLFLMHVCLSRLSVIISLVAIALLNDMARRRDELIGTVAQFALGLLSTDDTLTTALLESLSLVDMNGGSDRTSECRLSTGEGKVHMGVLRALFFFCGCVYESQSESSDEFYNIMVNLLHYVYVNHSDKVCLVTDANNLLVKVLGQGVRGRFLSSDRMTSILLAIKEERIELLCVNSDNLSREAKNARSGLLTALTFFIESRHYAGCPTLDIIPCVIARLINPDHLQADVNSALRDLSSIADGVHQPESFFWILNAVVEESDDLANLFLLSSASAPLWLRLSAKLSNLATQLLRDDNKCEIRWGLVSFLLFSITYFINVKDPSNNAWKADAYTSDSNEVSEIVIYDIADIMYNMFSGHWCNLGVALFYSKDFILVFGEFLSFFLSTPVELLMARKMYRERVFHTLMSAFVSRGTLGSRIYEILDSQQLWQSVLRYFVKCLHYTFLLDVLLTIDSVLMCMERNKSGNSPFVDDEIFGDIFEEVVIHITVSSHLERRELELCFDMLSKCFHWRSSVCTVRMNDLLEFCSAYHRVRLRHILTLLRTGKGDLFMSYVSVFGRDSKVQTLSAW